MRGGYLAGTKCFSQWSYGSIHQGREGGGVMEQGYMNNGRYCPERNPV